MLFHFQADYPARRVSYYQDIRRVQKEVCRQIPIIWDQIYDNLDFTIFRMVVFWIFLHYTNVSTVEWPL